MATAQQKASAGVYVTDDIGLEVTDGTNSRVQLGLLPTGGAGTYGLRVVSADGTTVIIDGTSEMFRIAATGTQSVAFPAAGNVNASTTALPGLGSSYSVPPATRWNTAYDSTLAGGARAGDSQDARNLTTGVVKWSAFCFVFIDVSPNGTASVQLNAGSYTQNPATTAVCRWHVLAQAAI